MEAQAQTHPPEEREIDGSGGIRLFVRHWPARRRDPQGLVAIVPGFSDHGDRYPHLVEAALRHGYTVAALDTRGHGRSTGARGHVESFDDYILDVDRFLAECRRDWALGAPLFVWGHSMGGMIAIAYLSAGFGRGAGLCAATVCAPPFRIATPVPRWKTALASTLSKWAPGVAFKSPVRPEDLSRDLEVGQRYMTDPLVHNTCSPRLYTELTSTASRLFANPMDYGVPTMFIQGTGDKLCDPSGTKSYFERSPLPTKQLKLYEDARHEVHNDPAHVEAFRDVFAFFDAQAAAAKANAPKVELKPPMAGARK